MQFLEIFWCSNRNFQKVQGSQCLFDQTFLHFHDYSLNKEILQRFLIQIVSVDPGMCFRSQFANFIIME